MSTRSLSRINIRRKFGMYFLTGGLIIEILCKREHDKAGNVLKLNEPNQINGLCTNGIYSYSRNPVYIGGLLITASFPLLFQNNIFLLANTACIWSFLVFCHFYQLPMEEAYLEKRFGREYTQYQSRVNRWMGKTKLKQSDLNTNDKITDQQS